MLVTKVVTSLRISSTARARWGMVVVPVEVRADRLCAGERRQDWLRPPSSKKVLDVYDIVPPLARVINSTGVEKM